MTENQIAKNSEEIVHEIWQQLQRASVDKHHEWRSPVLVTNGLDECPDARTVILRNVNIDAKKLTFYTDSRSPKVAQLLANPNALLVFWSKRLNWQLRIRVTICVETDGELAKNTWQKVKQSPTAKDYLSTEAPGSLLQNMPNVDVGVESLANSQNQSYFAMLTAQVQSIDWLALNRAGHQRATINNMGFCYTVP
jgi:pyridoxamine 5'-phosphate oxidase